MESPFVLFCQQPQSSVSAYTCALPHIILFCRFGILSSSANLHCHQFTKKTFGEITWAVTFD